MDFPTVNATMQMHDDAVRIHQQMHDNAMRMQQQTLLNQQLHDSFIRTTQSPIKLGILPPKDWKPDPYAGLGPELSPQEKLKKKWQDLRKPMYAIQPHDNEVQEAPKKKTVKEKIKDFGHKVKEFFRTLPQKILCKSKKD